MHSALQLKIADKNHKPKFCMLVRGIDNITSRRQQKGGEIGHDVNGAEEDREEEGAGHPRDEGVTARLRPWCTLTRTSRSLGGH